METDAWLHRRVPTNASAETGSAVVDGGASSVPHLNGIDSTAIMEYIKIMESTVTTKNMISIPVAITRKLGIKPGWKLDWKLGDTTDELTVKVIPDRVEMAKRLFGKGETLARGRDVLADLIREREEERLP